MKLTQFSKETQTGLRLWAYEVLHDDMAFDFITSPDAWAWIYFQLRVSADWPEWFPKGKSVTLQEIEERLMKEAALEVAHA